MYELSRARLHAVGPKGARYQDVTLDLRRGLSGEPSDASVLFLENGGGKTVLVRLIFSVILPGRRQIVGTSNSKMLEKFVLASDVAHVALEWRDTQTGDLLVTGKASEWRGHVVSADSNRLTGRWYTFRPTETLDLGTLPFTQDGRIVSLAGFRERLDEADRKDSALQVRWEDRRGEWTEHLDSLRLDPELFSYQRKMNAGEGEAADAFTFKTDEAFVDWLLTRARHEMSLRQSATRARMSKEEIEAMISRLGGLAVTLHDADPDDKSEVYQQLGLRLTYQPRKKVVRGAISLEAPGHWFSMVSEGGVEPIAHSLDFTARLLLPSPLVGVPPG